MCVVFFFSFLFLLFCVSTSIYLFFFSFSRIVLYIVLFFLVDLPGYFWLTAPFHCKIRITDNYFQGSPFFQPFKPAWLHKSGSVFFFSLTLSSFVLFYQLMHFFFWSSLDNKQTIKQILTSKKNKHRQMQFYVTEIFILNQFYVHINCFYTVVIFIDSYEFSGRN